MKTIRVLVFGGTGIGKTSLCNTITGGAEPTDNGAKGVTSSSFIYPPFQSQDVFIELVDTVGLHESAHGTVPAEKAVVELISLLEKSRDGFNLLIHVTKAGRITKEHDEDYAFFVKKMTEGKIPVVLAITGCENEEPMMGWVTKNSDAFTRFNYKALIPGCFASGGRLEDLFRPLREESKQNLITAIHTFALSEAYMLYGEQTGISFNAALTRIWNEFVLLAGLPDKYRRQVNESIFALMRRLGVSEKIARAAVTHIPDLLEEVGNKTPIPHGGKMLKFLSRAFLEKLTGKIAGE